MILARLVVMMTDARHVKKYSRWLRIGDRCNERRIKIFEISKNELRDIWSKKDRSNFRE